MSDYSTQYGFNLGRPAMPQTTFDYSGTGLGSSDPFGNVTTNWLSQQPGQGLPGQPAPPQQPATGVMGAGPGQRPGGGIDPSTVQAMMSLRQQQPQMEDIARQRKMADMLRAQGKAQMQGTQAGRAYRAPTALNAAADVFANYVAMDRDRAASAQSADLAKAQGDVAQRWFNDLTGRGDSMQNGPLSQWLKGGAPAGG